MTEGIEPIIAERFIGERLEARPALVAHVSGRIHGHAAPQAEDGEPDYPFVLVTQEATPPDVGALGGILIWAVLQYVVRVVDRTASWDGLITPATEIEAALANVSGDVVGGTVHACTRVRPFLLPEVRAGVQYRHLGGVYRLLVKGT